MAAAASTAQEASSSISRCTYDVFLSFRGEDTRKNFTDHLYTALVQAGIHTFRDDDEIERGENIEAELEKAIEESKISIIVFSPDYASSRWCLNELVMIMELRKAGLIVLPVFYHVDPSQVRKQTGSFAEAFARHEKLFNEEMDKVQRWRAALTEVANLAGMPLNNRHESQFIQDILREIWKKLDRPVLNVDRHLVGINSGVKDINLWLQDGSNDVSIATIFGIGGIGKTTIAKTVYNLNSGKFQGSSFLADVRDTLKNPNDLVRLQRQLLSDLLKERMNKVSSVDEGIRKIKKAICCRKVLIVFDDVDKLDQLDKIIGRRDWLSPGSKIIITTRHADLLGAHEVCEKFEVKELGANGSLQLFSWYAFGQDHPTEGYMECSRKVVDRLGGLPLALKVLGSSLSCKNINEWESALQKLEAIAHSEIQEVLKISYDSLNDDHDQNLFLDIACFFIGEDKDYTMTILDNCDFYTKIGIQNLINSCLLIVDEGNKLMMHQLIRDMGREIVRKESIDDPGKRSRLWRHKDAFTVLKEKTGTQTVKGLTIDFRRLMEDKHEKIIISGNNAKRHRDEDYLDKSTIGNCSKRRRLGFGFFSWQPSFFLSNEVDLETKTFMKMKNLKLLKLNYVKLSGGYEYFSKNLIWLCWHGFPLESIPTNFDLEKLVVVDMRYSSLKHVWKRTRFLADLKFLDVSHSHCLIRTPDFSKVPSLERLILEDCINLVEVDKSIGNLDQLVFLNLNGCKNLRKLPREIGMLKSLEKLILFGCSKLDELPRELRKMESLKVLDADGIAISQSHAVAGDTKKLSLLPTTLWSWFSLTRTPRSISFSLDFLPRSLVSLSLAGCNLSDDAISYGLGSLPSLRDLDLSENPFHSLPESIKGLTMLKTIRLEYCTRLQLLPEFPKSLNDIYLNHCTSLKKVSNLLILPSLPYLDFSFCKKLVEIEGVAKLEPLKNADIAVIESLGLSNLESLGSIEVDMSMFYYRWMTPLQVLHECVLSVFLPGSEIPSCFDLQSTGSLISFDLPPLVGHKVRGLNLCTVYTSDEHPFSIISNKTKRVRWSYTPICYAIPKKDKEKDMLWLSHWEIGDQLEVGDQLDVSVRSMVKKFGIYLVYEPENKGTQSNSEETVGSAFPWYQTVTLTKAGVDECFRCHHSFAVHRYVIDRSPIDESFDDTNLRERNPQLELDTCFICKEIWESSFLLV